MKVAILCSFLVGCATISPSVCPSSQGHHPEILETSIVAHSTTGISGLPAQEFKISVLTFVEGTNAVLWVNGQVQGLFVANGAFVGPRTFSPRMTTEEEFTACQGKQIGTVFEMRVGAVNTGGVQPLAHTLISGETLTLKVDVCTGSVCVEGVEKTLIVE